MLKMLKRLDICKNCKEFVCVGSRICKGGKVVGEHLLCKCNIELIEDDNGLGMTYTAGLSINYFSDPIPDNCLMKTEYDLIGWNEDEKR